MAAGASRNSGVKVKITPPTQLLSGILKNWQYSKVPQLIETEYRKLLNAGVRIMKQEAPSRTGALRNSIKIKLKTTSGGRRDKRYHGRVGPSVRYAQFVDRGTGPSPGRFVLAIEKRVRDGMHPGTPKNPFVKRTIDRLNQIAQGSKKTIGSGAKRALRF